MFMIYHVYQSKRNKSFKKSILIKDIINEFPDQHKHVHSPTPNSDDYLRSFQKIKKLQSEEVI